MHSTMVIVQARMMSTRLPGKILKPFYNGHSILELQLERISKALPEYKCVVATTTNPADEEVVDTCEKLAVNCFRGSENDVLQRFIDCADTYKAERVVRVCSDNPFLDIGSLNELVKLDVDSGIDYLSYCDVNGTPAIRTHWGLFAEVVSLDALKKVATETNDLFYHEHVTNYIYGNSSKFNVSLINAPAAVYHREDLRFTIDTPTDFEAMRLLYEEVKDFDLEWIVEALDSMPAIKQSMKEGIDRFSK